MELPEGVHQCPEGYQALIYAPGTPLQNVGIFQTPEKAEHERVVALYGHYWQNMPEVNEDHYGFIYLITEKKTGKAYVGSKVFRFFVGPHYSFSPDDRRDPRFKPEYWKESDWSVYTGSQKDLNEEIKTQGIHMFRFEVLHVCHTKLELHLAEVQEQIDRDVLWATDENGEYRYFNRNIGSCAFRPVYTLKALEESKRLEMEALQEYYKAPLACETCGMPKPYRGECECWKSGEK